MAPDIEMGSNNAPLTGDVFVIVDNTKKTVVIEGSDPTIRVIEGQTSYKIRSNESGQVFLLNQFLGGADVEYWDSNHGRESPTGTLFPVSVVVDDPDILPYIPE